ncbi:MAG: S-layer protein [Candidatus ainarchaeum sp.]|nr:S-layer protein [Candidatus ainarchaeum sp.]
MKGLNIKKLAAVAVGSALVGSALAPIVAAAVLNTADQLTKADLVNTTTGAPTVQVAVGSNAAISDFIWAGNIAAKVAQLATTEQPVVVTAGGEGGSTPTISDKTVDVTVGGTQTYSSTASYLMTDSNYPLNSGTGESAHEFIKELGNGQLQFLTNSTKTYTYNGSTSSVLMKEEIHIDADAKFDKTTPVKDLGLSVSQSGFKYVLSLGSATNNGIPAENSAGSATAFNDGDNDNMVIPFLGESYTINQIDTTASPITMRLIKESAKTTYYTGNEISGLKGKGAYAGQELKVKVAAVTASGPAASSYSARMDLYDSEGNLIDTQTISTASFLDEMFLSNGAYVLDSTVYISTIAIETETNKGYVTATVGTGVLRLADTKQFPYDSTDTNTSNDYWIAGFDFNSTQTTTPSNVKTLQKVTIKNSVQRWDNTVGYNPLFAGDQSLIEAHKTGSQEATFMEGVGLNSDTLGYGFVKLKFDGFKQDKTTVTQQIGRTADCTGTGNGSNTGCVVYKDSGNLQRAIPFYLELSSNTGTTWNSFYISNATFWYRCDSTDVNIQWGAGDSNSLNGAIIATTGLDINKISDYGNEAGPGYDSKPRDLNGVTYVNTGFLQDGQVAVGLLADGNCQFSSTDPTTTATYIGMGVATPMNNTIYYSDTNGARQGKASFPLSFTAANITDTYKYAFTANEAYNKAFLLLDRQTNFSTPYSNFDITFLGSDKGETGNLVLPQTQWYGGGVIANPATISNYRTHYLPDTEAMGQVSGNNDYIIAQFGIDANSTAGQDLNINIDTGTGRPIAFPNTNLSSWTVDVNAAPWGNLWTLTTNTSSDTYLQAAYLDYGTKVTLVNDYVTIVGPETQTYLKLTAIGKAATTTVSGGEALTGLAEGQKGKTTGGTEVTVDKINVTATCPAAGGAVAAPATYKQIYPVGEMVVADTVAPAKAIIVGGYLVNNLARDVVLSDGTRLTEALTASGDRVVDVLNDGSVIVAGYTASDTKQAAQDLISALDTLLQ